MMASMKSCRIKSLPVQQRWEILERTREMLDADIPESFKEGMREIARDEVIELDEALKATRAAGVKHRFRAAKSFRRALARLTPEEKRLAADA